MTEQFSIADIAGLSLDDVKENRGGPLPVGVMVFQIKGPNLDSKDSTKNPGESFILASFPVEVAKVITMFPKEGDPTPEEMVGRRAKHDIMVSDLESLGRLKAFFVDIGLSVPSKSVETLINESDEKYFIAKVTHRKDPNDKSVSYTRLSEFKPYTGE